MAREEIVLKPVEKPLAPRGFFILDYNKNLMPMFIFGSGKLFYNR